ncbi:MAG TPA: AAA family ATPase [Rhodopila sp.]|nr:AAA family ATPase [Rhodopila sp.]
MRRPPNLLADKPAAPAAARPPEPAAPKNYVELYGLSKPPFGGAADKASYILFPAHRRAFELVVDHLLKGHGAVLVVGDEGIGKTEMLRAAANVAETPEQPVLRLFRRKDSRLSQAEFVETLAGKPNATREDAVQAALGPPRKAIVIDEFDLLPADCLHDLRTLMEAEDGPGLVLTVSSAPRRPEVTAMLGLMRNTIRLIPISPAEAGQFIERSLWIAGGTTRRLIEPDAMRAIISRSGGMPGAIGRMMEAALTAGFARGDAMITTRTVTAAIGARAPRQRLPEPTRDGVAGRALQIVSVGLFLVGLSVFIYKAMQSPPPPAHPTVAAAPQAAPATPAAKPAPPATNLSPDLVSALLKRGQESIALGDIAAARLFWQRAAEGGSAPAALALGKTYDPNQPESKGAPPDPAQAAMWYRKAESLGDPTAAGLLQRLGQH